MPGVEHCNIVGCSGIPNIFVSHLVNLPIRETKTEFQPDKILGILLVDQTCSALSILLKVCNYSAVLFPLSRPQQPFQYCYII
jgi:hypothetical protein